MQLVPIYLARRYTNVRVNAPPRQEACRGHLAQIDSVGQCLKVPHKALSGRRVDKLDSLIAVYIDPPGVGRDSNHSLEDILLTRASHVLIKRISRCRSA